MLKTLAPRRMPERGASIHPRAADLALASRSAPVYGVYRRQRNAKARAADGSNRRRQAAVCSDVRFQVDGHTSRYGFEKKALADEFADKLLQGYVAGGLFVPHARRFLAQEEPAQAGLTFYAHATDHFRRKWPTWWSRRPRASTTRAAVTRSCSPPIPAGAFTCRTFIGTSGRRPGRRRSRLTARSRRCDVTTCGTRPSPPG